MTFADGSLPRQHGSLDAAVQGRGRREGADHHKSVWADTRRACGLGECIQSLGTNMQGWEALKELGIDDVSVADFGDAPVMREGEVPVFWGCGVTPQLAITGSPEVKGTVLGHAPGKMVCLDLTVADIVGGRQALL